MTEPQADEKKSLLEILRCPYCLSKTRESRAAQPEDRGQLQLFKNRWLLCQDNSCGRKYPVYDGLPIMLIEEAERWRNIGVSDLPLSLPRDFQRIPLVEPSLGSDDGGLTELERMNRDWRLKKHHIIIILFLLGIGVGFLIARFIH